MVERDIHAQAGAGRLAGTLCLPDGTGPFPVVLMVHGSGPPDRDQNMKGQKLGIFNVVAHRLANDGIASVRFDKRGCGASEGDYLGAGHQDLVGDVIAWCDVMHATAACRPGQLFLLGHSEGCLVAAQASLSRPRIAGLMLLCPFVEPMEAILMRQARQIEHELATETGPAARLRSILGRILGGPVASQRALIRKVRTSTRTSVRIGFDRVPARWLRELLRMDFAQVYAKVSCPMLLVGGDKDLQCDPADVARIAAIARAPVQAQVIAGMTHVLRRDDRPATLLGVRPLLSRPVEPDLLERLTRWLQGQVASGR